MSKADLSTPNISNDLKRVYLLPLMELFSCKTLEELEHKLRCELAQMRSLNLDKRLSGRPTATEASLADWKGGSLFGPYPISGDMS